MEFACLSAWDQLPGGADALFTESERSNAFVSLDWFRSLSATTLAGDESLLLCCVLDGDATLALLPLTRSVNGHWHALSNGYTPQYTILVRDDADLSVFDCVARGLRRLPFSVLRLEPIDPSDRYLKCLQNALEGQGFSCHRYFRFYNWCHPCQGQMFSDYLDTRPSMLRNTIERKRRRLDRDHGHRVRVFTDRDIELGLADYQAVYGSSWKANEAHPQFIGQLVCRLASRGWLRLGILYAHRIPIAAQLWIVAYGKACIFRLAYDEAWRQYSPGSILTAHLIEHVVTGDQVKELDFLIGNERYKRDWMSRRRERWGLTFDRRCTRLAHAQPIRQVLEEARRESTRGLGSPLGAQ